MSLAQEILSGSIKHRNKVTPLPLGRLRVERWFDFDAATLRHAWHAAYGKDVALVDEDLTIKIFGGFGLLDGALPEFPSTLSGAYTKRAYKDCRLIEENCAPTKEEHQLYQVYETLKTTWEDEDYLKIGSTESGLMTAVRSQVAIGGTAAPYSNADVGVAFVHVLNRSVVDASTQGATKLFLAGFEDNSSERKGSYASKWVKAGILNQDEDLVGSQKAIIIEAFGMAPATPVGGYVPAKKGVGNVEGIKTNRYTFLKPSILMKGEQAGKASLPGTVEHTWQCFGFDPATADPAMPGLILGKRESDYEGIKTWTYNSIVLPEAFGGTHILAEFNKDETVRTPGTIRIAADTSTSPASAPYLVQKGRSSGRVNCDVKIYVTPTKPAVIATIAKSLAGLGVGVSYKKITTRPIGYETGTSITASVFSSQKSMSYKYLEGYYAINATYSGTPFDWVYPSMLVKDDDNIIGETLDGTISETYTLDGSTSAPPTTGIYDRDVSIAFTTLAGTIYYRVEEITIPA